MDVGDVSNRLRINQHIQVEIMFIPLQSVEPACYQLQLFLIGRQYPLPFYRLCTRQHIQCELFHSSFLLRLKADPVSFLQISFLNQNETAKPLLCIHAKKFIKCSGNRHGI